jgi:type IVB pilus formation R64 PilN family outer membrane protein
MNSTLHRSLSITACACLMALTGCAVTPKPLVQATDAQAKAALERAALAVQEAEAQRIAQQEVNKPFLAGAIVSLPKEVVLPDALKRNVRVSAIFNAGGVDLATAIRQLSMATRVPISVTPDALMSASAFGPRLGAVGAPSPAPTAPQLSGMPGAMSVGMTGPIQLSAIAQDMPLWTLLDEVARQAHVSWRVSGQGAEFYRTETRMFKLEGLTTVATTSASSGRAGTAAAFSSDSKTTFTLDKQDPVAGMRTTIEALLTQGGRATVSGDDQTVVVTDTPEALARVAAYIEQANRAQARSVRLVVEAIEVVAKDNQDLGVDWNLVYSSLTSGAAASTGLARLASSQANALSLSPTSGRFKDSSVVLRALSDIGTVVSKRTFPLSTRSGRPVTQTLRTTFNYVDQVSAVTSTGLTTAAPAPTVTQKEETVGTVLTLIPKAMDNGQIFLNMSFDVSTNEPLTPFTVGSSSNGVTVQQKVINAHGALQEVSLRSGETVLLGGIDVTTAGQNQRRLAPGAPLVTGGSDQSSYRRSHIVIVVTAVAEDI